MYNKALELYIDSVGIYFKEDNNLTATKEKKDKL